MRILITTQTYAPISNGQSSFSVNLAEGLSKRGHEVAVLAPAYPRLKTEPQDEIPRLRVHGLSAFHLGVHPDTYLTLFPGREVSQVLKTFRPQVLHLQDHYLISFQALKQAQRLGVKTIGTNHFMPENLLPYLPVGTLIKGGLVALLWQWMLFTYNQLDVVTAPSKTAASILRRFGLVSPVYPISCGIDLNRFQPNPGVDRQTMRSLYNLHPDKPLLLFVGRVDGEKKLDVLLQAFYRLKREDIQLAIAGRGAALRSLQNLTRRLGLDAQVRFLGHVPDCDLPDLLNSADIFVMPSEAELLSIATLEAMACGLPILAANAQALPELVTQNVNGYLFRPGDPFDAARYIALMMTQAPRWRSMGAASAEKVQPHGLDSILTAYENLYDSLAHARPLPRHAPAPLPPRSNAKRKQTTPAQS